MSATCGHRNRRTYPDWDGLCWTCHDRKRRDLTFGAALVAEEQQQREGNSRALLALAAEAER